MLTLFHENEIALNQNMTDTFTLTEREKVARIQLYRTENVGPITFYRLLQRYQSAEQALSLLPELARRGGRQAHLKICSESQVYKEIELHHKYGADFIVWGDPLYPTMLQKISDASPVLSIKGNVSHLKQKALAIVGARNCSLTGKKIATTLAQELGEYGYVITSGLARGIDTAAHQGSLTTGTIAVIAGGIDQIYPPENEKLYQHIAETGLLIAETPFGMQPQANLFPRRNRLISGLSLGVIVVEAALQSGSLITTRYANEQGKDVFVVPGSPLDPRYGGSNQLLKQGAILITSSQDCIDTLEHPYTIPDVDQENPSLQNQDMTDMDDSTAPELTDIILNHLCLTPISLDELIRVCRLSSAHVLGVLLQLELAGKIIRHPGNYVSRAP